MRSEICSLLVAVVVSVCFTNTAGAQITEIEPFEGDLFDGFETYGMLFEESIDFFEGQVTVRTTFPGPSVFVLGSSTFNGVTVTPRSGLWLMGVGAPGIFEFHTPVSQIGAYFATNSQGADATVEFFDVDGGLIGTMIATIDVESPSWTWNGWRSDVPIGEIKITGNGSNQGFIDFDDMWITFPQPEPPPTVATASDWAIAIMATLILTAGALAIRGRAMSTA